MNRAHRKSAACRSRTANHTPATTTVEVAASLQASCCGWLIIWSPWHRTFTAFAACTPQPLVIDEETVHALLDRIGAVEPAVSRGRPVLP